MFVISLQLLYGAYVGTISKYLADETAPAVSTDTKAVTKGVRDTGGLKFEIVKEPKVMIRCRNCGELNDEDANYCDECGEPL